MRTKSSVKSPENLVKLPKNIKKLTFFLEKRHLHFVR